MQQHGMAVDVEGQASLEAKLDDEPDLLPDELEVLGGYRSPDRLAEDSSGSLCFGWDWQIWGKGQCLPSAVQLREAL